MARQEPIRVLFACTDERLASVISRMVAAHESFRAVGTAKTAEEIVRAGLFDVLVSDLDLGPAGSLPIETVEPVAGRTVRRVLVKPPGGSGKGFLALLISPEEFQERPLSREELVGLVRSALK
ncbi:MAG: hypothetical protein HY815_17880 [Candidatus Riflebacteria bacterium]|nr:hypothetical protein [Candidatus Riflebacteria bacterium]